MTTPIVFLGTDDAAAACLGVLADRGLVALVVTPPERRKGRSGTPEATVCGAAAVRIGLPVLAVEDVNEASVVERICATGARLLVVVSFGQYLRRPVRESVPLGGVNLHYSRLPRWRGAAPVQRAILAGDATTAASVQRVAARLDAGDVLAVREVPIGPRDDTPSLRARLTAAGAPLLAEVATRLLAGEAFASEPQDESAVTLAPAIERSEGDLDLASDGAAAADRRIRALEPWPRCRARFERREGPPVDVFVREAVPFVRDAVPHAGADPGADAVPCAPGEVVAAGPEGIFVATRDGVLRITRLQRTGGKDLDARAFLNGCPVAPGDRLVRPPPPS